MPRHDSLEIALLRFWLRIRQEEGKKWDAWSNVEHKTIDRRIVELGGADAEAFHAKIGTVGFTRPRAKRRIYEDNIDQRGDVGLIARRPSVNYGQVVCAVCNGAPPCDFDESAIHQGFTGQGMVLIRATHHGEICDIAVPFSELRNRGNPKIYAFGVAPALPETNVTLPQPDQEPRSLPPVSRRLHG